MSERRGPVEPATSGVLLGVAAYLIWGAMPLYFRLLAPSGPWEILAHRIVWSLALCLALLATTGSVGRLRVALRDRRTLLGVTLAGLLISCNWTVYLYAVSIGRVTEAALGYFLNPLVSVALGLVVLHERLRPLQWLAVALGAMGGLVLALAGERVPWIAFALAVSFGLYGLAKKLTGASLSAVEGLTAETLVPAPIALAALTWWGLRGEATFGADPGHSLLLASTGVATAVPLLLFAACARRVTLVTVGMLQFISPVMQFATGLALGETLTPVRWVGFGVVWSACIVLMLDTLTRGRFGRRRAPAV